MSAETLRYRTHLDVSAADAFRWHARPGALERLTPPWESVQVLERTGDRITDGTRVTLGIRLGPLRWRCPGTAGQPAKGPGERLSHWILR